jgi:hypothetical protein
MRVIHPLQLRWAARNRACSAAKGISILDLAKQMNLDGASNAKRVSMAKDKDHYKLAFDKTKVNRFGLPLDNRATYAKLDWTLWAATPAHNPVECLPGQMP